ncbi:hypothetical protein C943_01599 [Mariniradius saccharolyticus AK6]|uniref:Uncharacterized protein n=1 Tax=Mariniradius saccharolyticus AK6 TaxID=1239962 RepID=M7XAV5_9BACT|nr:hypothetical protein [Mariniradius saccharolyticus]EMS32034.1 hypothetical protein C943_01599 [Mariniradius saccharolyticus AK6]
MKWKNLKLWGILALLILVIGAILYQQSRNNRDELKMQAIRGMEITRQNLIGAYDSYHQEIEGYFYRILIEKFGKKAPDSPDGQPKSQSAIARTMNGFFGSNRPVFTETVIINPNSEQLAEPSLEILYENPVRLADRHHLMTWDRKQFDLRELPSRRQIKELLGFDLVYPKDFDFEDSLMVQVSSILPLEKLLKKDQNNRFFDHIILADENGNALYPNNLRELQLLDFKKISENDTLSRHQAGVRLTNFDISLVPHMGFWIPVQLNGKTFYLIGTKQADHFDKVGLRINFNLLTTLIYGLIILLLSIPILSILNLEKGDILSKNKVFAAGFSLMFLMTVLGFGLSQLGHLEKYVDAKKENFDSLRRVTQRHLESYLKVLNERNGKGFRFEDFPDKEILELIEVQNSMITKLNIADFGAKSMIKLDFANPNESFIDISGRDYVRHFDVQRDRPYFIGAQYSRGSGELEAVISRKGNQEQVVEAITFALRKVSPITENHRYLLFKEGGKVLHKSDGILTPLDQIPDALEGQKWAEIKNLMEQNPLAGAEDFWEISMYLNGDPYIGILQLVDGKNFDQNVWSLYLINKNLAYVKSSLVSLEAVVILSFYLLMLVVMTFINKFAQSPPQIKSFVPFAYAWLFPTKRKQSRYLLLTGVNTLLLLALVLVFFSSRYHLLAVTLVAVLSSTIASLCLYLLAGPTWRSRTIRRDLLYILLMLLLWAFGVVILIQISLGWVIILVTAVLFGIVAWLKYSGSLRTIDGFLNQWAISSRAAFVVYMISWSLLLGFLPGMMIHGSTFRFEESIWNGQAASEVPESKEWIETYEKFRRNLFSIVGDNADKEPGQFISPPKNAIYAAFEGKQDAANWSFWKSLRWPWIWLGALFGILVTIYFLISNNISKIYLLDFDFDNHLVGSKADCDAQDFKKVFLCSLDTIQKKKWIACNLGVEESEIFVLDLAETKLDDDQGSTLFSFPDSKGKKVWLIENIHCVTEPSWLSDKIPLWLEEAKSNHVPLVLGSGKSWKQLLQNFAADLDKVRFSEIFVDFFFEIVPIDYSLGEVTNGLERELAFGQNPEIVHTLIRAKDEDIENQVMLIQRYNKAYYANIWAELSFMERKVCYYFSREGFMNPANWDTMTELVQKGILRIIPEKDKMGMFNRTFRHYILNNISEKELQEFKTHERANGNANTIQIAGVSFVLLSLAMIGYFDKNFLNEAYAYLSGILGAIGSIYSLFSKGFSSLSWGKKSAE